MGVILDRLGRGRKNVPGHRRVRNSFLSTEEKAKSSFTKMNEEEMAWGNRVCKEKQGPNHAGTYRIKQKQSPQHGLNALEKQNKTNKQNKQKTQNN